MPTFEKRFALLEGRQISARKDEIPSTANTASIADKEAFNPDLMQHVFAAAFRLYFTGRSFSEAMKALASFEERAE